MLKNAILFLSSTPPFLNLQGFLMIVLLSLSCLSFGLKITSVATYDVTSYGAKGDGNTDDSNAFLRAWDDLCGDMSPEPTLIIPSDKTFLINLVAFKGPCKSPIVNIKLLGNIVALKTLDGWKGCINNNIWIYFTSVQGLKIQGPGQIYAKSRFGGKRRGNLKPMHAIAQFPNTDGIDIGDSSHVNIHDSNIQTGDDCVAINGCHY
ncbi:unnamed protein product [Lactuca saligna]|uniref:Polygalacturonase n=1 Tax=Lactuca saligna TaxID=75948 RepID=A0AA35V3F8_LACSI|nr:unnamed protein product [Lactuca saligna]